MVVTGCATKTSLLEELSGQSAKQLEMRVTGVGNSNAAKVSVATTCIPDEVEVGKVLICSHAFCVKRDTKHRRKCEVAIFHHAANATIDSALLNQVGHSTNGSGSVCGGKSSSSDADLFKGHSDNDHFLHCHLEGMGTGGRFGIYFLD